ncbi:peptidoglycan endopeptidase [Verminephrobacter aporrectodeae subsp. tuberculatae]|uniref:Peptidoglycan endopeptidase n=1 Tax=Verminephrobacter aporrectodeae subsp. tuberculatae TaxID=1110392 RepID=A0ABT3KNZ6_9BURK|nr:C40 family peptidase [Verminephrobacter aporrectodeae]MCW5257757.1 peptidoglycan endopeptidase [Verminephrobacter aporrectodeae subsp. tuberculatae]MCW5320043.1 peptidoglycan endopeptidase [Verminephrobacter aporrectodeae subsp. tuberculatae]MCW8164669.1 peptidoglycan endopeptidase [Verminephrobacter aporrectodeae subsp. tuberculatae]MCW8169337.1 peptidoglycan endopeptidase [Verminephrobacter aporrectodeae subsp. tuberculatae]MCW8206946.1 peptidoglycan endopeptidase [Verminephrobacter aporr
MSRWFCALLLACASAAQAAPDAENSEIMDRWLAEQGLLLTRIEDMGYEVVDKVTDRAQTVADQAADLVNSTMGFLGVPYKFGGSSAATGFDCSGFVRAVYEQTVGLLLPRRAEQQAAATRSIDRKELRPGDLVFFNTMRRNFSHVGIYVGDDKFIHAPHSGSRVRLDDLGRAYWTRRFNGARRVTPLEDAGGTQSAPQ